MFQYGRANIEQSKKYQNKDSDDDDDEGYSEEICPPDSITPQKCNSKSLNGLKESKNGYANTPNGNTLISRDDKLMLIPEPPTNQHKRENSGDYTKDAGDDQNNVSSRQQLPVTSGQELKGWSFLAGEIWRF